MTFFSHVFKDKELQDISNKIDDLVSNIPIPAEPSPVENVTGKFIDQVLLKSDDSGLGADQQKLFEDVSVPAERLARYSVYREINRSVPIIKRIIKVYTSHLLQKNPVDGKCIIYRESPKVTKDDDDQIKEARKFAESVENHFDLPKKLKNSICPKKLLFGNCFVEVVDVKKESEKVDLSKINLIQETKQLEIESKDINGNTSTLESDLLINKISNLLHEVIDKSENVLEQEEIKKGKMSEEKEDEESAKKTEEDIMNPFLDVLVKVHDPHSIIILQSKYGTRIGYLEVHKDTTAEFQSVAQNISNVVGKITTLSPGGTPEQAVIDKIISNILKKTLLQSNNFDSKKIESTLKALGEDVYIFIKRLFIEQNLGRKTKYNRVRTRFIPVNKMVDFSVPSSDYSPLIT